MIIIGVVASALALYLEFGLASLILAILALSMSVLVQRIVREYPPVATWLFPISTFLGIVPMGLLTIYCYDYPVVMLLVLSAFAATGIGFGSGMVWISGRTERRRLARSFDWLIVVGLGLMPLSMAITPWPLRVAFAFSRPSMERIADRVAAGGVNVPEWAGVYRVVGAVREPSNGNIALLIDANPAARAGFVRFEVDQEPFGPLRGLNYNEPVGGPWRYQIED